MVAEVRVVKEYFLQTGGGHQTAVVESGETEDPGLPVLLLGNVGLVQDLGQNVEDNEDEPTAEQGPAAFTTEELSCPGNVGVPAGSGSDVGDGEEHREAVSSRHQATNLTEGVHDDWEPLGVDVGGQGVLPEVQSVLLVDGHAVVWRLSSSSLIILKIKYRNIQPSNKDNK